MSLDHLLAAVVNVDTLECQYLNKRGSQRRAKKVARKSQRINVAILKKERASTTSKNVTNNAYSNVVASHNIIIIIIAHKIVTRYYYYYPSSLQHIKTIISVTLFLKITSAGVLTTELIVRQSQFCVVGFAVSFLFASGNPWGCQRQSRGTESTVVDILVRWSWFCVSYLIRKSAGLFHVVFFGLLRKCRVDGR